MEQWKLSHINITSAQMVMAILEICLAVSHKIKQSPALWSKNSTSIYLPKRNWHMCTSETCTRIFLSYFLCGDRGGFIWPPSPFLGHLEMINTEEKRRTAPNMIHSSPKLEMTPMSFNKWMDTQLSSNHTTVPQQKKKEEWIMDTGNNANEAQRHSAIKKPDTKE